MSMKQLRFAVAACIAAFILGGCAQEPFYKTEHVYYESATELAQGAKDSLRLKIDVEIPVNAPASVVENITKSLFGKTCTIKNAENAVESYKDGAVKSYRETNMPLWEEYEDKDNTPMALNWEEVLEGYFSGEHNGMVSYTIVHYCYTGGAHGMTDEYTLNFDKKSGKEITEEDIFKAGYEDTLNALLTANVKDVIGEDGVLFVDKIETNGNFCVSENCITYIYGQYEIAPYSMGIIKIPVLWESLSEVLKQ
ncbi:MAG: DUF3298 domain-containing protein [Candidatus Cryptobacteroides sp.]